MLWHDSVTAFRGLLHIRVHLYTITASQIEGERTECTFRISTRRWLELTEQTYANTILKVFMHLNGFNNLCNSIN